MNNPNDYDDSAFLTASNAFQMEAERGILELWEAGASLKDLEMEIAGVLDNALESNFRVQITEDE